MARFLVFILGIAVIAAGAYFALYHSVGGRGSATENPRALENVRSKAQELERDSARRAEETLRRTE